MNLSSLGEQSGTVESIQVDIDYLANPLLAYTHLCSNHSMLLESAEIDSKDHLKSLVIVDSALRIESLDQTVIVQALSENGRNMLPYLKQVLSNFLVSDEDHTLRFEFENALISSNSSKTVLNEDERLKAQSVFDVLRQIQNTRALRNIPHAVFLGGVFSYDLLGTFEALPKVDSGKNTCSDYVFYLAETLILVDHTTKTSQLIGSVFSGENVAQSYFHVSQRLEHIAQSIKNLPSESETLLPIDASTTIETDVDNRAFCQQVIDLKEHILDGDIFQVVPSRTFTVKCQSPLMAYQQLKLSNPSPYMFYMQDSEFSIFGASPESALKYESESNQLEVYPIAGTRPRGKNTDGSLNLDLDSRLELDLQQDAKEKAEHIMLVDLARNDVAKVSIEGTRCVKDLLKVDRYSHVMHLVSRVIGQLKPELDALHAYQACMNMGTLVGAPKISAAKLIRETEKVRRGSYGGAVGYINGNGDFDTCIVIRSAFVKDGMAHIQAGAGVVYDSVPQSEADETRTKAQAVISAVQRSQSYAKTLLASAHKNTTKGAEK